MKALLVAETREGKLCDIMGELLAFAAGLKAEASFFLVGEEKNLPEISGKIYLADAAKYGEFSQEAHTKLLLVAVSKEEPDCVVFPHSSYGIDLAPRLSLALQCAQVSEVVDVSEGGYVVPCCNSKLRRRVRPKTKRTVLTLQMGAFSPLEGAVGAPTVEKIDLPEVQSVMEFIGYEREEKGAVDLSKEEIIVGVGRGIGKKENLELVDSLAKSIGAELGASRPVVDAGWMDRNRQIGISGQSVSPKLYIACGISGAVQHLTGMKRSGFIVAVNTDKDAPIAEVADVLVVADVKEFLPVLTEKLKGRKS